MRGRVVLPAILVIWLLIGLLAAVQRGYFSDSDQNCADIGSTLVTIVVGPLNYIGVNPTVECPGLPEPSE
ncbi:hypothetical protein LG943_14140 [Streptomonospora sp. S1-112]|uniref:Uncharacterized protein n=1 Tax=Streptomonospora mangrovi TaxID=2883123 RepID=A0A9X3NWA2_9ACTN|nr:hypothetical protein [Streptomonospora mangrovi]MDA0565446.1 hypothetical protein [Streptomonospora mangrovi]